MFPIVSKFIRLAVVAALGAAIAPLGVSAAETPASPAEAHNKFDILEFRVLGNHVLPPIDIERAVYPFLGPGRDIDTVKKASEALEKVYKDAGYGTIFVDIPEQQIDDGIVRLKVTEGRLDRIHIRGERYFSGRQIRAALPELVSGQTPHLPTLQQELADLNSRTPDRIVTPILKAGAQPGAVDIDLAVKDTLPFHGSVEADNRHTADTTPNRATIGLSYDNLWQRQDSLSLQYQTAPADTRNASVESATYLARLGAAGGVASFSVINTSSNVLALGTLGVLGKGTIYGAHWLQPLDNTEKSSRSFTLGVDYKDVQTRVFTDNADNSPGTSSVSAPVKYLNWSGSYSQAWRLPSNSFAATFGVGFGVRDLVNRPAEFENARYNASPDYLYLRLSGEANQSLPADFAAVARLTSQWSDSPLVNNEQFSLGGVDTVRGYLEAETLGDIGVAGTLELHGPRLGPRLGTMLSQLYPFGFVDAGIASLLYPLPGQNYSLHLWSTGVGLRLENAFGLAGALDYAVPMADGTRTGKREPRVDFTIKYGF